MLEVEGEKRFVTEREIRNVINEAMPRLGENDKNILIALTNYICKQMTPPVRDQIDQLNEFFSGKKKKDVDAIGKMTDNNIDDMHLVNTPNC